MDPDPKPAGRAPEEVDRLRRRVAELQASESRLRRVEQELAENERRFRAFSEAAFEGVAITERGRFLDVSRRFCEITGYEVDDLIGRPATTMIPEEDREEIMSKILAEYELPYEARIRRKDGVIVPVEVCGRAVRYKGRRCRITALRDITDRKQAEESIRAGEAKYRSLVENLREHFLYLHDTEGVFTYVSPSITNILGFTQAEFQAHYSRFLTDNPVNEEARRRTELALQGHPQGSYELEAFDRDGGVHLLEITEVPVFDEEGRVIGVEGIGQDVTARKRGDRALRESEEQFRTLVANIPGVVFRSEVGPPWRIEYVSEGVEALTGYPARDFMDGTRTYGSVIVPGDLAEVERLVDEAVAERRPYRIEYQVRRADGGVRWVAERGRAIYDAGGEPLWLDGVILDITDRRQAEEALRSERDFTARLIDSSMDGILAFDREYRYTLWNAGMERISGLGKEDVLGRVAFEVFPFLTEIGEDWFFSEALAGRAAKAKDRRYVIPQTGREGFFEGHYGPLFGPSGEAIGGLGIIRDSTRRIRADQERRKLEAQVQQTQKLESLGVLAGGIAHDFNNLLVAILGNADLALGDLSDVSGARASVLEIKKASMRAADLANQMLAYSGRGRFVVTALNLNELVKEMGGLLKVSISKKITLNYTLAGDLPPVEADAAQIRQVVMNLITNASEAIGDEPGIISISTGVMDAGRDYLAEAQLGQSLPAGRYVYLQVTDTGCGIDPQSLPKLFEPFYTTKFTGRGLGLAAVLGIVRGHHGAIKVESQVGEGTSFRLLLPRAAVVAAPAAAKPAPPKLARGRGVILVVDDERTVRELARKALERAGFTVLTADDGREGVAVFGDHADEISAVLLDMTMPEISGEEAFDALRRVCPDVPILLASGYTEEDITGRFEGRDLAGFIHKPFELRELIAKVRQITEP